MVKSNHVQMAHPPIQGESIRDISMSTRAGLATYQYGLFCSMEKLLIDILKGNYLAELKADDKPSWMMNAGNIDYNEIDQSLIEKVLSQFTHQQREHIADYVFSLDPAGLYAERSLLRNVLIDLVVDRASHDDDIYEAFLDDLDEESANIDCAPLLTIIKDESWQNVLDLRARIESYSKLGLNDCLKMPPIISDRNSSQMLTN